ncbi:MAG: transposase [Spirochaetales bacterium]|nr:transposase [Spirochaetales bacterium]
MRISHNSDYAQAAGFSNAVRQSIRNCGLSPINTSIQSPWQNGIAERWIKSIRHECLDHVIVCSEKHAYAIIKSYRQYYNHSRPHMTLDGRTPCGRAISRGSPGSPLASRPAVNGLQNIYRWQKEAA